MMDDTELLRRYAEDRAEDAFAELVRRHLNLVHSVALRQLNGDTHLAADVAQAVFTDLARKAPTLVHHRVLAGWLFTSTRFAAAKAVRTEQRRHTREQEAHLMQELTRDTDAALDWERVRPVLDEALGELADSDREAILLRFFEGRDFASIGARLELNANTARMRVERALDKLRARLEGRGLTSTSAALAAVLAHQAVAAAPAGLAVAITGAALAGGGALTAATATATGGAAAAAAGAATFMSMTKLQLGLAGAIAVAGATGYVVQGETSSSLRRELEALRSLEVQAAALRAENDQLKRAAAEAADLRGDDAELARLRDEALALQSKLQAEARVAASATTTASSGQVFEISKLDQQPVPRFQARPVYPSELRTAGVSGEVVVDFVVDANGDVQNAFALRSSQREFEAPATAAISKWKFKPGRNGGQNVNTHMQVPIVFTLSEGERARAAAPEAGDAAPRTKMAPFTVQGPGETKPAVQKPRSPGDWF